MEERQTWFLCCLQELPVSTRIRGESAIEHTHILSMRIETYNVLNDTTPDQYERITSMCPISQPNLDLLRKIQNISTSSKETPAADGNLIAKIQ